MPKVVDSGDSQDRKMGWYLLGPLLALIPAFGYALAYTYEVGFCDFYKIPKELIQLDWTVILIAIASVLGGLLIFTWLFTILFLTRAGKPSHLKRRFILTGVMLFFLLIFAVKYLTIEESRILPLLFLYFILLMFVFPLLTQWKVKGYRNKLIAEDEPKKAELFSSSQILKYGLLAIFILFLCFGIANLEGRAKAMNQQVFYIPSTHPNSVVLRIYGENLICAHLITEHNQIEQAYFVLKTTDESNPVLRATNTGYLRVRK